MGALLSQVTDKPPLLPPRIVVHGKGGVGKTRFAANVDGVLFMPIEDGLTTLDVNHLPRPTSYGEVMSAITELANEKHKYKALAIDTIDHLEPLVWANLCAAEGKKNIETFGYGKGYTMADSLWIDFFCALDALRINGMTIIVLCHNESKNVDDPQHGSYTRVTPKLHKRANALMYEWADVVGYLDIERVAVDKGSDDGLARKTRTLMSSGQRVLYLEDMGGFVAKNRYDLPSQIQIPKVAPYQALRSELLKAIKVDSAKEAA